MALFFEASVLFPVVPHLPFTLECSLARLAGTVIPTDCPGSITCILELNEYGRENVLLCETFKSEFYFSVTGMEHQRLKSLY